MSAPSIQSELGTSQTSTDRQVLEAAIALAPTISLERVLNEAAQQIRRVAVCDAVAIAVLDPDLGGFQLAHSVGFEDAPESLTASLTPAWQRALSESRPVERDLATTKEITVPMTSGGVRGAVTVVVHKMDSSARLSGLQRVVASLASQVGSAIDRADVVDRLANRRRLEAIGEIS